MQENQIQIVKICLLYHVKYSFPFHVKYFLPLCVKNSLPCGGKIILPPTQEKFNNIKTLMETMNWNPLQAMNALKIPEEEQQRYTQLLKQ